MASESQVVDSEDSRTLKYLDRAWFRLGWYVRIIVWSTHVWRLPPRMVPATFMHADLFRGRRVYMYTTWNCAWQLLLTAVGSVYEGVPVSFNV